MAELYGKISRWFREAFDEAFNGPGREAYTLGRGGELTEDQVDELIRRHAQKRQRPALFVVRGSGR